jgi:drug/metabolite transporter (DMT)-like permease
VKSKTKQQDPLAPARGPRFSVRFLVALLLMVAGIAWIAYYYTVVRVDPTAIPAPEAGDPKFMADLKDWNYLIGFGLLFLGLVVSAHRSTPLGRGRGVVVGMLGCFLIGLAWICTFYVISDDVSRLPIFDDLGQKNLFVGIGFMAVGFTFATRWE